jgi:hypothetical protein
LATGWKTFTGFLLEEMCQGSTEWAVVVMDVILLARTWGWSGKITGAIMDGGDDSHR